MWPATTYSASPDAEAHSALPACMAYCVGPLAGEAAAEELRSVPAMSVQLAAPSYSHTSLSYCEPTPRPPKRMKESADDSAAVAEAGGKYDRGAAWKASAASERTSHGACAVSCVNDTV